ncbi:transcriptional regulator [Snodgrassella alvi]|jgi:transcriptional regulator with XRE-family HTH domain|uniref:transcriptional regulator n=1 Tax=Snodgrassella alvi TaxID=1196083 RepID=UPI000CBA9AE8|nr:helix-turn-helix domain-containing protein [Snodgrassella alvi]PIT43386.1 hypothetical protein BHC51_11170 [Snodgrassella alvi]
MYQFKIDLAVNNSSEVEMNIYIQEAVRKIGNQSALARKLKVSKGTVSSWLRGINNVPPKKALEIEKLTNISAVLIVFPDRGNKYDNSRKPDFKESK